MAAPRYTIGKVFKFSYQGDIYRRDFKVVGRDGDLIKYVALVDEVWQALEAAAHAKGYEE